MKCRVLIVGAMMMAAGASVHADTISIRASVRAVSDDGTVRLKDIATLEGDRAIALGDTVIARMNDTSRILELNRADIRAALDTAGAHWGMIDLNGGAVTIRPLTPDHALAAAPTPMGVLTIDSQQLTPVETAPLLDAQPLITAPTLRGEIARRTAQHLRIQPQALRIRFDETDTDLLDAAMADYRFEIDIRSGTMSDRITLGIRAWQGGRVVDSQSTTIEPMIRTAAARSLRDISRGSIISASDIITETQWLAPSIAQRSADANAVIGRAAATHINTDDLIRAAALETPELIKRGDLITVRCLVGGLAITQSAIARSSGGLNDTIELRREGERETFTATITGHNEATVNLGRD